MRAGIVTDTTARIVSEIKHGTSFTGVVVPNELTIFTWIGALLLACCGIPQAWEAHRAPASTRGLSWFFLGAWGLGELAMFAGLINVVGLPVLLNYAGNILLIAYISGVKFVHRKEHREYHG